MSSIQRMNYGFFHFVSTLICFLAYNTGLADLQSDAQNNYYNALRQISKSGQGPPTQDQIDSLKASILIPAQNATVKKLQDDQQSSNDQKREYAKAQRRAYIAALTKKIESDPNIKTDADRQRIKGVMKDAMNGNFKSLDLKNIPQSKNKDLPKKPAILETVTQPSPPEAQTSIDGTNIPREIEFPGHKKKSNLDPIQTPQK